MNGSIGPLLPADEHFNHQIVDTFATVAQSDPAWAEKVCGMAGARDGSLQIGFGFNSVQGGFEHPDGSRELIVNLEPRLTFSARNKRLRHGEFVFTMADGSERPLRFAAISDTGVHLGAGLYHGYLGLHDGMWRGRLCVEGDYYEDCTSPAAVEKLNQFRDCMIRVEDPVGGAVGWGNCQTYVLGAWPEFGLSGKEPRF